MSHHLGTADLVNQGKPATAGVRLSVYPQCRFEVGLFLCFKIENISQIDFMEPKNMRMKWWYISVTQI